MQHFYVFQCGRCEIRNNYMYGTNTSNALNYGVVAIQSGDLLAINNIGHHMASAFIKSSAKSLNGPQANPTIGRFTRNLSSIGSAKATRSTKSYSKSLSAMKL